MNMKAKTTKELTPLSADDNLVFGRYNSYKFEVLKVEGENVLIRNLNENMVNDPYYRTIDFLKQNGFKKVIK